MAGDWIPLRVRISSAPQALFVRRACGLDADQTVGKLHRFWSWADEHTETGHICGVTFDDIDSEVGAIGFADAMASFPNDPWLKKTDDGVYLPNYQTYNGKSARRRLLDSRRKSASRADRKRTDCGQKADQNRTEDSIEVPPISPLIQEVLSHFLLIRPKARLTDKARKHIQARLVNGWTVADLKAVIDNWAADGWWQDHCGNFGIYDLFRSDDRSEKLLNLNHGAKKRLPIEQTPLPPIGEDS